MFISSVDNFEMTGLCQSGAGDINGKDTYISYGSASFTGPPAYILNNLHIHGASHVHYAGPNGSASCNPTGVVICINLTAFYGASNNGTVGESIFFNVVDFSDSDPGGENLTLTGFYNVAYNAFRYTSQGLMSTLHVFHDNLYEYEFGNGHSNLIESKESLTTNAIYNNLVRHVFTANTGDVVWWLGPQTGVTDYFFNNVSYDVGSSEYFNMGATGLTTDPGSYTVFNNTFQSDTSQSIYGCNNAPLGTVLTTNNHYIDNENPFTACSHATQITELWQSNTAGGSAPTYSDANTSARFDQYTVSETYAYSPTASTSSTVGTGTNEQSNCSALSLAASLDSALSDAATACWSDTPYACTYNVSMHSVSCPARTVVARLHKYGMGYRGI